MKPKKKDLLRSCHTPLSLLYSSLMVTKKNLDIDKKTMYQNRKKTFAQQYDTIDGEFMGS